MSTAYLNGRYLPIEEASISVLDRGFLFGDGLYEVIPVYDGSLLEAKPHLARLFNGLTEIELDNPLTENEWMAIFYELIKRDHVETGTLYLQITRGSYSTRSHLPPEEIQPTVLVVTMPMPPRANCETGISATTVEDTRQQSCHIKATTLLSNVLAKKTAAHHHTQDAIFIRDDQALEGTASNLFIVAEGVIITPPLSRHILSGVTRALAIRLAKQADIPLEERSVSKAEMLAADEVWLSSSTQDIVPVTTIDQQAIGTGKPGACWQTMDALFQHYKRENHHD